MGATHFSGPVVSAAGFSPGASSVKDVTGATTLTAADNGKIISLNAAGGAGITLPSATDNPGWTAKFVVSALFATSDWVITADPTDSLEGCLNIASTLTTVDAADSVTFEEGADNIGDWIEVVSDGTSWLVYGVGLNSSSLSSTG